VEETPRQNPTSPDEHAVRVGFRMGSPRPFRPRVMT
jgi:hypothetical protein